MFDVLAKSGELRDGAAVRGDAIPPCAAAPSISPVSPSSVAEVPPPDQQAASGRASLAGRLAGHWRRCLTAVEQACSRVELVPDLAQDIGSRTWLRGMATMLGLGAVALAFWPDMSAVEASTGMPYSGRARDEFRSRMIMPLGLGGDTGRRMAANARVLPLASAPERPSIQLVSTLGRGDGLGRMLERAGVARADIAQIGNLVSRAVPMADIAPGTRFDITLGRRPAPDMPRPLEALTFRARFDLDLEIGRNAGGLTLTRHPIRVDETPLRIRGTIGSSFYRSARNAGAPVGAIQEWLRAVDQYLSLESDLTAGDQFDMILSYKRSARGERQAGELLYAGIERGGKPRLQLLRWGKEGRFFAASGFGEARNAPPGAPVAGRVTSGYGMRRHPILRYSRMHSGVDYGARYGSPIYAVADGVVDFAGRHGGHGNYVRLKHGGGLGTGYGHMSRIAVRSGTRVKAGQVIGYVGSTGLSTGPHLHFEAYRAGRTINPASLSFTSRPQVDGRERDAFRQRLASLLTVQPGAALQAMEAPPEPAEEATREIDRVAAGPREVPAPPAEPAMAQNGAGVPRD